MFGTSEDPCWLPASEGSDQARALHNGKAAKDAAGQGNIWNRAQYGQKALDLAVVLRAAEIRLLDLSKERLGKAGLLNHAEARLTI